jgi:hypothetical protein
VRAKHEHAFPLRERDDVVAVLEVKIRLGRGTQPVPEQVIFGE